MTIKQTFTLFIVMVLTGSASTHAVDATTIDEIEQVLELSQSTQVSSSTEQDSIPASPESVSVETIDQNASLDTEMQINPLTPADIYRQLGDGYDPLTPPSAQERSESIKAVLDEVKSAFTPPVDPEAL